MSLDALRGLLSQRSSLLLALALTNLAVGCEDAATGVENGRSNVSDDEEEDDESSTDDDEPAPSKGSRDAATGPTKTDASAKPDAGTKPVAPTADAATPAKTDASTTEEPTTGTKSPTTDSLWCAALPVIQETCGSCHGTELAFGAPMPLVTYDDFMKDGPVTKGKVVDLVKTRIHATTKPMPPSRKLTAEELGALDAWLADGAKPGPDPTCGGLKAPDEPVAADWPPAGCEKTYKILAGNGGGKAMIPARSETHPQFIVDAPWGDQEVQSLGFRPVTDNKTVLHHWILYANSGGAFLTGWAPGQDETEHKPLPDDVGAYMPKGKQSLRLDMHYYNSNGATDQQDGSGVELCTTTKFRKFSSSTYMGFAAIPFLLPGQQTDSVGTCNVNVTQPVFLMTESPHAHKLATWMKFEVKRGGQTFTLRDEKFNFEEQTARSLPEPFELKNGDQVITTCRFNNDTSQLVTFGENTGSEMCFNFASYYPMGALSCALL